jgi:hypothetical protein
MNKIARLAVLVAALASSFAVMSSTAGAVTWHNTGSESLHATGVGLTLSVGVNNFACTGSTLNATSPVGSFVTATYSMTATLTYSPCTLAGVNFYMHCNATYTGIAWVAGPPALTAGAADVTCDLKLTSGDQGICHLSGTMPASYANPNGATSGRFTFTTSSTLTIGNYGSTSCFLGTGTAQTSHQTMNLTSGGPILTRTA